MHSESGHLRDYQAENRFVEQLEERRRNPIRRPNPTVDMFLSKEYKTYLLGPSIHPEPPPNRRHSNIRLCATQQNAT